LNKHRTLERVPWRVRCRSRRQRLELTLKVTEFSLSELSGVVAGAGLGDHQAI